MPRRPKDRSEYEGYDPIVTSPEPIERSEEEGYDPIVTMPRQDYKGFQIPSGMSLPQRRKWKRSIDVRESGAGERQEARDDADTEALKQGIIDRTKDVGAAIKGAAEGVGDVIKAPFEYRAALATDPAGTMAATKEFGSRVMSGDPEARRQAAEGVSMSTVEPFATAADAELARQDLTKGDYAGAAISGASVLLPFVSAGWLKTAMRKGDVPSEAAEKVAELERRVDAGEVTDDLQIRRELAGIEDAHASDYMQSKPPGGGSARSRIDRFASTPDAKVRLESQARERGLSVDQFLDELEEFEMDREIYTRDAFYDDQESGGKLFRIGDRYIEAADVDDALRLATNDDGLEHYVRVPRLDAYDDDDLRRLITEASPEESAKYFEMKRVNPRGDESGFSQPRSGGGSEGPSEAEIQAMVDQRFADPNELEMMKEDMRRMAELTQDEQIAQVKKGRTRRSRTPGAPGATEGSVKRERPMPKAKKGKYEN